MIAIIDYNMGNIFSIANMLKRIGYESYIAKSPKELKDATSIILPGVGSFDYGIKNLQDLGFYEFLHEMHDSPRVPVLGICLGMQLLTLSSEEGILPGLGLINANTERLPSKNGDSIYKIPHMGWNYVHDVNSALLKGFNEVPRFYFVHSFYVRCNEEANINGKTEYSINFPSIIHKDKIWGVQFHPEKSHRFGMQLLRNFAQEI
nr:imidazole glycerol phosphate synthase subunit HisH [uncultured Sphaerochaeta sp.]